MACFVTIDIPTVYTVANNKIVDITLTGTASASDCDTVNVTLNCSGFPSTASGVPVDAAGNWTVAFESPADPQALDPLANCGCGQTATVHVQCIKGGLTSQPVAGCFADWSGALECQPKCPKPVWLATQVSPKCNNDGTRTVTNIGVTITADPSQTYSASIVWVQAPANTPPLVDVGTYSGTVTLGPVSHDFPSGDPSDPQGPFAQTVELNLQMPDSPCDGDAHSFTVNPCPPLGQPPGTPPGTPPATPPGKPACGDALVWMAALAAAIALLLLGIWKCLPPQAQAFAIAAIVFLFFLSTLLMFIWGLFSFFNKCKLDWCHAAKIWIMALAVTSVILSILNPILNVCFFTPVWYVIAGISLSWAVVASTQCTSKP